MSKPIKIIPHEKDSEAFANIKPSSEFVPEWYRLSPSNVMDSDTEISLGNKKATNGTYKKCSPFYDGITSGYTVFLTADVEVVKKPDGSPFIASRTNRNIITDHHPLQWRGLPVPIGFYPYVFKWHNQFEFSTPEGYSTFFTHPINRFDLPFQTVSGIVDTDNFILPVHFPFFIKKDFFGIIEKGTPIAQLIPVKRDSWHREMYEYNENKVNIKVDTFFSTIKRSYKNNFWTRKEYK